MIKKLLSVLFIVVMEFLLGSMAYLIAVELFWVRYFKIVKIIDLLTITMALTLILLLASLGFMARCSFGMGKWLWKESNEDVKKEKMVKGMLPISPK